MTQNLIINENQIYYHIEAHHSLASRAIESGNFEIVGVMQLICINPQSNSSKFFRYEIGEVDKMVDEATKAAREGYNVYIEGRTVRLGLTVKERGKIEDTVCVFALVIDSDNDKEKGTVPPIESSIIVQTSPGNYHYWYYFVSAISPDEAQEIGRTIRRAGGDSATGNITQPYRVAGTPNYPSASKIGRGRKVCETILLHDDEKRYSSDDLRCAFSSSDFQQAMEQDAPQPTVTFTGNDPLLERLSEELRTALSEPIPIGGRSDHFFKVTGWLKRDGFSQNEAGRIWEMFPRGAADKYRGRSIATEVARLWNKLDDLPLRRKGRFYHADISPEFNAWMDREIEKLTTNADCGREQPAEPQQSSSFLVDDGEPLPIVNAASLASAPPREREWHVEGIMPAHEPISLIGDGGAGKSLLAVMLAIATCLNRPWLGKKVRPGRCLFLTAEDEIEEVHRRLFKVVGDELSKLRDLDIAPLAGKDALLAEFPTTTRKATTTVLYHALETRIAATKPVLVILDTLADIFGGDENNRSHARQFIGLLRRLAHKYSVTIVILSHPSLSGMNSGSGTSGSTAWNNSVRTRLYLERIKDDRGDEPDTDLRRLRVMKSNYGSIGQEISVRWRDGVFEFAGETEKSRADKMKAEQAADNIFMTLLAQFAAQGRDVSSSRSSPHYAPRMFARDPNGKPITKLGFETAMSRLFAAGRIREGKSEGPPSRQRNIIVAVESTEQGFNPPFEPPTNSCTPPC